MRLDFPRHVHDRPQAPRVSPPSVAPISGVQEVGAVAESRENRGAHHVMGARGPMMSRVGMLMGRLHELKENDALAFKGATADIAAKLRELAETKTGDAAERITKLAERFEQASENGDLSSFRPTQRPKGPFMNAATAYQGNHDEARELRSEIRDVINEVLEGYLSQTTAADNTTPTESAVPVETAASEEEATVVGETPPNSDTGTAIDTSATEVTDTTATEGTNTPEDAAVVETNSEIDSTATDSDTWSEA